MTTIDAVIVHPTDKQFELMDTIELFLETTDRGADFTPSDIQRVVAKRHNPVPPVYEIRAVLAWMEDHVYVVSNGRGGCWRRYGRRK